MVELGPCEILAPLGAGGMRGVSREHDGCRELAGGIAPAPA